MAQEHTIVVDGPLSNRASREYAYDIVLGHYLGLNWLHGEATQDCVRLRMVDDTEESVELPDVFFKFFLSSKLKNSQFKIPSVEFEYTVEGTARAALYAPELPVFFGNATAKNPLHRRTRYLPIDIFGSAFYFLSGYREKLNEFRDAHNRFVGSQSELGKAGLLYRPLVDEYVEYLKYVLLRSWPGLRFKEWRYSSVVTCDIDRPLLYDGSIRSILASHLKIAIRKHRQDARIRRPLEWSSRRGAFQSDPYFRGIRKIMQLNEDLNQAVIFFVIAARTSRQYDRALSLQDPRMRKILAEILSRGHKIGIHPGYDAERKTGSVELGLDLLNRTLCDLGHTAKVVSSRQHFLRWNSLTTPKALEDAGVEHDFSMGFADSPGFRSGTCRPYPAFDLLNQRNLEIMLHPLCAMECSVIEPRYLGKGTSEEAYQCFEQVIRACKWSRGEFVLLWHNSELSQTASVDLYQRILECGCS